MEIILNIYLSNCIFTLFCPFVFLKMYNVPTHIKDKNPNIFPMEKID